MKRYFSISHKELFLFGYVFYLFTPLLVGFTDLFEGFPGISLYQGFFKTIPEEQLSRYLIITLSWIPAFYGGHMIFSLVKPYKLTLRKFSPGFANENLQILSYLLLLLLLVFIFLGRNSLFGGYSTYDIGTRGKFSTLLVLYNFFLIYQLVSGKRPDWIFTIGILATILLLLSMGGRMYVFQTFIIILVYKSSFSRNRWKLPRLLMMMAIGFIVGGLSGIWRMGESFSLERAAYSLLAEPAFTWFSTSTFLIENKIPLFNIPLNFLTSFFNLVPNTVFSLQPYVVSTQGMGYITQSPLGADSVWTNLVINFGAIGSFFFVMLTGFVLNILRHGAEKSKFCATYYIMVCGILPFQFFRDGFYLLNKQLFFNFLILPGLILLAFQFLQFTLKKKTEWATV